MDLTDLSALLGDDQPTPDYRDIWVDAPNDEYGGLYYPALISEARRLADGLGCYVHALVRHGQSAKYAIALGADRAHKTGDIVQYLAAQRPEFVLFAEHSLDAPKVAQHFGAGLITGTPTLDIDAGTRALRGTHPVYSGEYLLDLEINTPVKVATVNTQGWPFPSLDKSRMGEIIEGSMKGPARDWIGLREKPNFVPPTWRPLQKARKIVAVGRGVGGEAGLAVARDLAKKLGAEFAGDRSARDSGWIDEAHEVGVTGQEVAPDIYVALGIFGDTIHNAAIAGAKRVIAIHPNRNAPIFKVADVAFVGDPVAILTKLLAKY